MHHVLIIEDDSPRLDSKAFEDDPKITLTVAKTVEEGLARLAERPRIEVLITDTALDGTPDGFELLLRAKDASPKSRVIVADLDCVHSDDADTVEKLAALGVVRFMRRDAEPEAFRQMIHALCEKPARELLALENMELTDIVQLACLSSRTAILHLRYEDQKGRIAFSNGTLKHAEFQENIGGEALLDLLALRQGNMYLQNIEPPDTSTINTPWQALIIHVALNIEERRALLDRREADRKREEAITESDISDLLNVDGGSGGGDLDGGSLFDAADLAEIGDLSERLPPDPDEGLPPQSPFGPPTQATPSSAAASLQQLMEQFCDEIPELIATDIVARADGLSIIGASAVPDYDSQAAGAFYSDFLNSCTRAIEDFVPPEALEDVHITTENAYILIRVFRDTPYMQLLMMHRTGNLGISKVTMRRFESYFAALLPQ